MTDAEELTLSWQDSLSHLLSAVHSEDANQMLRYTAYILQQGDDDQSIPPDVLLTVTKIHCRAHIQLKQYTQVIDFCISLQDTQELMRQLLFLEECYALYKLGRHAKCCDMLLKRRNSALNSDNSHEEPTLFLHLLAQCQYRLLETTNAFESYQLLLEQPIEAEERMEVLINALAVKISNVTVTGSQDSKGLLLQELVERQLDIVQEKRTSVSSDSYGNGDGKEEELEPSVYELMYNYGTLLLMTSCGLSQTQLAWDVLECAEKECRSLHEANAVEEGKKTEDEIFELKSNLTPIQANLALAKLMAGDETEATRSYLELILEARKAATGGSNPGALFAAETNLTVLQSRSSSSSANDLLTRLPTIAGLEIKGKAAKSSTITPNQIRTLLYNRALLYCRLRKTSECKTILEGLTQSLSSSTVSKLNGNATQNKKKRKKKLDVVLGADIRPAPPATEAECLLWKNRIAILKCELTRGGKRSSSAGENGIGDEWESLFQSAYKEVKDALEGEAVGSTSTATLEYALAELKLFGTQSKFPVGDEAGKIEALEGLSTTLQSCPATVATLSALYKGVGKEEKVEELLDSALDSDLARKSLADFKLNLGLYEEAAQIYESIIDGNSGSKLLAEGEMMECKAALVKALSYFNIEGAVALAAELTLNEEITNDGVDGEELEAMDIPRLSKGAGKGTSRIQKMIGAHGKSNQEQKKKQNRDAILRKRARRRDAYLQNLQKEGKYNPDRPVQPDPERWIPKTQRSYTKRGRRGRNKFVGAQGGGTGAGAEKDAAKLDVAARAAARAEGIESGNQQPSTAHLSVSSKGKGGRRR